MTISSGMYTKHYYNGASRVASRVGGGFGQHNDLNNYQPLVDHVPLQNGNDYAYKSQELRTVWSRNAGCAGLQDQLEYSYAFKMGDQFTNQQRDGERYFYHSDHLGSSAFITSENGYATQFLAYQPFGETLAEQQNSTGYYSPFKFSAKEKDPETGYSYFGARYYSPELSVWLGVDPMSDDYPHQNPYAYCSNNPVMRIDPTGMNDDWVDRGGQVVWDPNITGSTDPDLQEGDKYLGKETFSFNPISGMAIHHMDGGTTQEFALVKPEMTITPEVNYATSNPSISSNNNTGHIYNSRDLSVRNGVMSTNNPIARYLIGREQNGQYEILNGHDYWLKYGHTTGNLLLAKKYIDMANSLVQVGPLPSTRGYSLQARGLNATGKVAPTSFRQFLATQKGTDIGVYNTQGGWMKAKAAEYRALQGN